MMKISSFKQFCFLNYVNITKIKSRIVSYFTAYAQFSGSFSLRKEKKIEKREKRILKVGTVYMQYLMYRVLLGETFEQNKKIISIRVKPIDLSLHLESQICVAKKLICFKFSIQVYIL